ncbi:MAG: ABC transporter ATP-binding protein, partial [Clostridia bacterium]|nr:ABC transporter ATP-binding protein [Clostridia bacterium]
MKKSLPAKKPAVRAKNSRAVIKKLIVRLRAHRAAAIASLLLSVVSVALTLLIPVLVGRGIDCIKEAGRVDFPSLRPILI